jgi:predicted YcjX-like family ATPase
LSVFSDIFFEARIVAQSLADYVGGPSLRLGVTGLSRSGKTVFLTALIHHLTSAASPAMRGKKNPLPVFRVHADGRLASGTLEPQPDDAVPRFAFEDHLAALTGSNSDADARHWPESTRRISELRLRLDFERAGGRQRSLTIDIVDYPGEWLLDLPLLGKSFTQWSLETLAASATPAREKIAAEWRQFTLDAAPDLAADEDKARRAAELFTAYLRNCRADDFGFSTLPPGRFLMPGDLEGSPALTFAPLAVEDGVTYEPGSFAAMMERRYESYKAHVVRPFFRDHFARLDRQIVLVDALAALNAGPAAVRDLETAITEVLMAFRTGRRTIISTLLRPHIDKILFAATKADHLHHESHDRLEAILRHLTARAISRAEDVGAAIDVIALASVRSTREARVGGHGDNGLDAVIGTPLAGEKIGTEVFDGHAEAAIFPGELPLDPRSVFRDAARPLTPEELDYRFVRFRPPVAARDETGKPLPLPHIRLDRALQFLLGDRLA